ncbi:MAG TPA: transposase [Aggregatilineales bacterium]|nr:transposase [Aggregatilineales bacterium]
MLFSIQDLVDDTKCYEKVRELRWPNGVCCPACDSVEIKKRGKHTHQKARQRYHCKSCHRDFDDLTDTVFEGHHQPLKVWILCLYFMGLNLSNQQIAAELDLNKEDVQGMTEQLRVGVVTKKNGSTQG